MKVYYLLVFCFVGLVLSLNGQSNSNAQWSDEYSDNGYYTLLSETSDGVIVLRKYRTRHPERDRDADLELIRFNSDLNPTHSIELKDLEKSSYADIGTISSPEGIAHMYYQTTKSDKVIVSAQLFDKNDLHKTDVVTLAQFKVKSRNIQRVKELTELDVIYPVDYVLSSDKSKVAIVYHQDKVGKNKETYYQYVVIDVGNSFNLVHKGYFYSDGQSKKYKISDLELSNDGGLTYLIKRYDKDVNTEFVNKKPAYDYELHHMMGDTTDYIYDIKVKDKFIDHLMLGSDTHGNLFVAGYLRKRPLGPITATYFLALDHLGYELSHSYDKYRPREIEKMQGKEDTELDDDFKIVDVLSSKDMVYVIKQYRQLTTRTLNNNTGFRNNNRFGNNNFGTLDYDWDFEELVVEGYDKNTGDRLWAVTNPRRQEEDQEYVRSFIRGHYQVIGEDLYLFYNERPDNLTRLRKKEKLKSTNMPGDVSEPVFVRISNKGDITYRSIKGERRYYVPSTGILTGEENLYLIHSKSNFRDYKIGKASIELLNF